MVSLVGRAWFAALAAVLLLGFYSPAQAGTIRRIHRNPPVGIQLAFLMTDGTVLGQSYAGNPWYKYTPDAFGNYATGTWTQVGSLQNGYDPDAFASAVLADGRFVIIGGEYNYPGNYYLQLTNLGAIYDPVKGTWTPLGHPKGWKYIGDSPSAVLPTGQYLLGQKLTEKVAYLDPKTLRWTQVGSQGKSDFNSEEGWVLLPDGSILTEDVKNAPNSERYIPSSQSWVSAGSTIVDLHSPTPFTGCLQYGPKPKNCYYPPGEIGPAMLRPDGTVFAAGSGSGPNGYGPGHSAIYHTQGSQAGQWTVGPDFPNGDNAGDSFAALLPSGNVWVLGVSGEIYEFDGTKFIIEGPASGSPLLLPSGQVMEFSYSQTIYTPQGSPQPSWAPAITSSPTKLTRGRTYQITGTQFNGLSMAMAFGDEYQNATNYPLVRITNNSSGHVAYARTHDVSTMGVATGSMPVTTSFDVPATMDKGASALQVVANGIASLPISVTVK